MDIRTRACGKKNKRERERYFDMIKELRTEVRIINDDALKLATASLFPLTFLSRIFLKEFPEMLIF